MDINTVVENHLQLPTEGPSSIRTFHLVPNPPQTNYNVHIMELRGDADHRLMNDDVLCLYQLTIQHPDRPVDTEDKFRVLWTPKVATRDRILFHLRVADICRTRTCHLMINGVAWREMDSITRHFQDGDYIHLKVTAAQESSVIATRCDIQSYEVAERQRRVFTNSTSSHETDHDEPTPSTGRSRSRSGRDALTEQEEESDPPQVSEEEAQRDTDEESLLQISPSPRPKPQQLRLTELVQPTSVMTCDFTGVDQARQLLTDLPWIMDDIKSVAIPSSVLDAVAPYLIPWQRETPTSYHIYTDGSFHNKFPNVGGCGAILMIDTVEGLLCGGVLSRTCLPTSRSHSAESVAMLWATLIAYQLSDHHCQYFPGTPFFIEFGYDAEVTGQQCAGNWTSFKHPAMQQLSRNMIYILQHRHGTDAVHWTHIKAHQGHCWNEIADKLAGHATRHPDMVQTSDLLYALLDTGSVMTACDWIWALEQMEQSQPSMPTLFDNHLYHFRTPTVEQTAFPSHFGDCTQSQHEAPSTHTLKLKVATLNVMTLDTKRDKKLGTGTAARHLSLLQQCDAHALHVVGVQETRAFKTTNRNNPFYHIISSPCRQDGHYGMQIWIHRHLSLGEGARPIQEDDYRLIWMNPNVLAIRLKHPTLHCCTSPDFRQTGRGNTRVLESSYPPSG